MNKVYLNFVFIDLTAPINSIYQNHIVNPKNIITTYPQGNGGAFIGN